MQVSRSWKRGLREVNTANILMKNFMTVVRYSRLLGCWLGHNVWSDAAGIIGTNQFFLAGADNATWELVVLPDGFRGYWCYYSFRGNG